MTAPPCFCGSERYRDILSGVWQRGRRPEGVRFTVAECQVCTLARTLPVPDTSLYEQARSCWSGEGARVDTWSARIAADLRETAPGRRLLDVGCNVGNLVAAAANLGFDAEGIDLDPSAIAEGRRRGARVSTTPIEELEGPYDAVVMNHVLEHVPDLRDFVGHVGRVLAPDGILVIQVPYYKGVIPRLMRTHWFAWAPDEHVWHFSRETLERVVSESAALHPVKLVTKGVIEPPSSGWKGVVKKAIAASATRLGRGDQIVATFAR